MPYLLHPFTQAIRLASGEVAVSVSGSHEIRIFGIDGTWVRSFGSEGRGPGEFGEFAASRVWQTVDGTLLVDDSIQRRIHHFSADGHVINTTWVAIPERFSGSSWTLGVFGDGSILHQVVLGHLTGEPDDLIRNPTILLRLSPEGRFVDSLTSYPSRARFVNSVDGITHYPFIPFSVWTHAAVGPDTTVYLIGDRPEITRLSRSGAVVQTLSWNAERAPITSSRFGRYRSRSLEGIRRGRRRLYEAFYAKPLPIPKELPVAAALLVDKLGFIWIERYRFPWDEEIKFDVIDPESGWLGTITLPEPVTIYEIGADYLLGLRRDGMGVEQVVMLGLRR